MFSARVNNNGVYIHYLDSINTADQSLTPILICPGLSETAEEYEDMMSYLLPRRSIVLSFRGRGQSDTPLSGYGLDEHVSDIDTVVEALKLDNFHLFAYSRGVSYALGYCRNYADKVISLIVEDYPSEHRAMPHNWQNHYIEDYLIPEGRLDVKIRAQAVHGIQVESKQEDISFHYERPILILRGLLDGAIVTDDIIEDYRKKYKSILVKNFPNCSHDIRERESIHLFNTVKQFVDQNKY